MANIASTIAPSRVGILGQVVAAGFFVAAVGAGIWVTMDAEDPVLAFWDTALKPFTWGLLALGLAWVGDGLAGKRHHPDFLRVGALFVVVSALAFWGGGAGHWDHRFFHLDRLVWAAGAASLVFVLAQSLDYTRGRPLARTGFAKIAGVGVMAAGVAIGIWANDIFLGGKDLWSFLHWRSFWSWFQVAGLLGLLTIGLAEMIRGLAVSLTMAEEGLSTGVQRGFAVAGHVIAAVFLVAAVGVAVWQSDSVGGSVVAFWETALRPFTWGLLVLSLVWVGEGFMGRRRHPNILRIAALLVVLSSIVLWWEGFPFGDRSWLGFLFRLTWAAGAASVILVAAQVLDYSRGRPLARMRVLKVAGVAVIAAGVASGIWYLSHTPFGSDAPRSLYWFEFWREIRLPTLLGLLTIGLAEVAQGMAEARAIARSEPGCVEPQAAP